VEALVEAGDWARFGRIETLAQKAALAALEVAGVDAARCSVSVMFAGDAEIAVLNQRFRCKPGPTNVLSWPAFALAPPEPGAPPPAPPLAPAGRTLIGDVALAAETILREAEARGLAPGDHLAHLIVHGVLHLLGYDHGTDADAGLMEGLERRALAALGVSDPYA
jgi:probable rRNA maturation factor